MIPPVDQVNKTVASLVHFFRERGYDPGERLPSERDLSVRFGITRNVLREALKSLEWMRIIERRPKSGLFMRAEVQAETSVEALVLYSSIGIPFDAETDLECLEVRQLLEVQAVMIACQRRTEENILAMKKIVALSEDVVAQGQVLSRMDYDFHMQIFEATQNKVLVQLVTPFYLMSEARREIFFSVPENFTKSLKQHQLIVEAIETRDADAAGQIMAEHIGQVEKFFGTHAHRKSAVDVPSQHPSGRANPV